eukprot:SAG11_NODE_1105_length_5858_cov_3.050009_8_plen_188_part_00
MQRSRPGRAPSSTIGIQGRRYTIRPVGSQQQGLPQQPQQPQLCKCRRGSWPSPSCSWLNTSALCPSWAPSDNAAAKACARAEPRHQARGTARDRASAVSGREQAGSETERGGGGGGGGGGPQIGASPSANGREREDVLPGHGDGPTEAQAASRDEEAGASVRASTTASAGSSRRARRWPRARRASWR